MLFMWVFRVPVTMSIYTRTGDDGTTTLFGGKRLSKSDEQIEAYGSLDELTSTLGVLIFHMDASGEVLFLQNIQRDLYVIMGYLANAPTDFEKLKDRSTLFEKKIDELSKKLPPLNNFILPSGSLPSVWAHMTRVGCRRAERVVVHYFQREKALKAESSRIIVCYLNRLSDLLFTYARFLNDKRETISKKV